MGKGLLPNTMIKTTNHSLLWRLIVYPFILQVAKLCPDLQELSDLYCNWYYLFLIKDYMSATRNFFGIKNIVHSQSYRILKAQKYMFCNYIVRANFNRDSQSIDFKICRLEYSFWNESLKLGSYVLRIKSADFWFRPQFKGGGGERVKPENFENMILG